MAKRGSTDLSLVLGIDKPSGMTSHDVVNRVRRITGERRVGHMGTLDPLASGVMCVCVGPAARLNPYLVEHDKLYEMEIEFGTATNTDDAEGEVVKTAPVPESFCDSEFARNQIEALIGPASQVPPAFSAIKVHGVKAYEQARKGDAIALEPRDIEIYDARFLGFGDDEGRVTWKARMRVSKGTYIRSIARDLGEALGSAAHLKALRRIELGSLAVSECATLDRLEDNYRSAIVDPLLLLPYRFADAGAQAGLVANGRPVDSRKLEIEKPLFEGAVKAGGQSVEHIALLEANRLRAIYEYGKTTMLKPACVFAIGVERG